MPNDDFVFDFSFQARFDGGGKTFGLDCRCLTRAKRLAIVGASGSGKSLTLKMLAGLIKPDRGHIRIGGTVYADMARKLWLPPQRRQAGLVFQDYALFPHLTVAQNIAFGLQGGLFSPPHRLSVKMAAEWLDKMQLGHIAAHYPNRISGGQRQRTALARACAVRPKWLLLDEPFSALDADLRAQMREQTAALQRELDIPMLLITHDHSDADVLADEVAEMGVGVLRHERG